MAQSALFHTLSNDDSSNNNTPAIIGGGSGGAGNKQGSWLSRVSHRASHIPSTIARSGSPLNPLSHTPRSGSVDTTIHHQQSSHNLIHTNLHPLHHHHHLAASPSLSAPSANSSHSAVIHRKPLNTNKLLPLRPPASAGAAFGRPSHDLPPPSHLSKTVSSPSSPIESSDADTPIDSTFGGERILLEPRPSTALGRLPPELPPVVSVTGSGSLGLTDKGRSRSGTAVDQRLSGESARTLLSTTSAATTMDKYARQAGDASYDSDAEADDEFERSVFSSPIIAGHFNDDQSDHPSESEDDRSVVDGGDTPTTQGWADRDGRSPTGKITQWSEEEVADYIAALSPALKQYGQRFVEEGISGEALVSLHHDELRELGVNSVGHRLTILKAVYEQKMRAGVKIEEGDYVPLSAEGEKGDMNATQDDIARIIESIKLRDQRIIAAEAELRAMKLDLDRIMDENKKLREETLPIMRIMKDQRTPLPDPSGGQIPSPREAEMSRQQQADALAPQNKGSSLSRKFSTKKLFLKSDTTKQPSPTHPPQSHTPQPREVRDDGGAHLEASAAAMAASNHLTASMTSQTSPNSVHGQQLSPTSPAYSTTQAPGSAAGNRSFPRDGTSSRQDHRGYGGHAADDTGTGYSTNSQWSQASTAVAPDQPSARLQQDRARRQAPTPSPREDEPPHSARDKDNPQVEIFKSFRVGIEDPCRTVLPVVSRYHPSFF